MKRISRFSALCLTICAAATALSGCAEGGREFFEAENPEQTSEISGFEVDESTAYIAFAPSGGYAADDGELNEAKEVIKRRVDALGVEGYELEIDRSSGQIMLRCPTFGAADSFEAFAQKLCERAELTFREGTLLKTDNGDGVGVASRDDLPVVLDGGDVKQAFAYYDSSRGENAIVIEFKESGAVKFGEATERLSASGGIISVWMDDVIIAQPRVTSPITDGQAVISGGFTAQNAFEFAEKINCGALPFEMEAMKINTDF